MCALGASAPLTHARFRAAAASTSGDRTATAQSGAASSGSRDCGNNSAEMHASDGSSDGSCEPCSDDAGSERGDGCDGAPSTGVNSLCAKLERALQSVPSNVHHCVWIDRGLSDVATLHKARALGYHATAMMGRGRVGLPRRYIASLINRMACPRKCVHACNDESPQCSRWRWVVLHKGPWELTIWFDRAKPTITLSDCTSATRMVWLARTVGKRIQWVLCPEAPGLYNLFGRSATDTGDQHRKRLSLAVRRQQRQGPKGALFDAELALVDCCVIWRRLQQNDSLTVWDFADAFCEETLDSVSMRRRETALHRFEQQGEATRLHRHRPVHPPSELRRKRRTGQGEGEASSGRGVCCRKPLCAPGSTQRGEVFCPQCARELEGCNGWYHFDCFWDVHECLLSVNSQ